MEDLTTAQQRIYEWAKSSPDLRDKIACDMVFTALREGLAAQRELAQLQTERGGDDE